MKHLKAAISLTIGQVHQVDDYFETMVMMIVVVMEGNRKTCQPYFIYNLLEQAVNLV